MKLSKSLWLAVCLSVCILAGSAFGLQWHQAPLPEADSFMKLAVAPDGSLYMATRNLLSKWNGSSWESETIPDMSSSSVSQVGSVDLKFSPDGRPHLLYTYPYGTDVIYCTKSGGTWKKEYLFQNHAGGAMRANLGVDATGVVYVAAVFGYSGQSELLNVMTRAVNGVWTQTELDSNYRAAWWPDTEVAGDNSVHIAYTTGQTDDLKYAVGHNGSWTLQLLDSAAHTGYEPSLKVTSTGLARIGYFNVDEGRCYLQVENSPGNFTRYSVDSSNIEVCSVNLLPDGAPLITYVVNEPGSYLNAGVRFAVLQNGAMKQYQVGDSTMTGTVYSDYFSTAIANGNLYVASRGNEIWWASLTDIPTSISGKVIDQRNMEGLAGATVYFSQSPDARKNPEYTATTDAQGNYNQELPQGIWHVTADKAGYTFASERTLNTTLGSCPVADFALAPTGSTVFGKVTDRNTGAALPGASVHISQSPNSLDPKYLVVTDALGNYSQEVTSGTWYVRAGKDGYVSSAEATVIAFQGTSSKLDIALTLVPLAKVDVFYKFDEAAGTTAMDSSGFGKNGTTVNGPLWTTGKSGNSLSFDGADDYVSVPDLDEYPSVTISAWINLNKLGTDAMGNAILACDGSDSGDVQLLVKPDGRLQFILAGNSPADPVSNFAFTSADFGKWRHVAVVYDSVAKTVKFYINGRLDATRTLTTTRTAALAGGVRIGGWSDGRYFGGKIDEFHIYGHTLSDAEISNLVADTSVMKIGDAKRLADGELATLVNKTVIYAPRNSSLSRSTRYFYVEEPNKSAGLLVYNAPALQDNLLVDTQVTLTGVMKTMTSTGQRYMTLSGGPAAGADNIVKPLGMNTKAVQKNAAAVGLLVRVVGKVVELSPDKDWFTMRDGYGVPTIVICETGIPMEGFEVGDTVVATGVVGTDILFSDAPEGIVFPRSVVKL